MSNLIVIVSIPKVTKKLYTKFLRSSTKGVVTITKFLRRK